MRRQFIHVHDYEANLAVTISKPVEEPSKHGAILLVEDNESDVLTFRDYLESHGYAVRVARNGVVALEMVETYSPDLILMDILMPGLDGLEVIRRLRMVARFDKTPIIALTAFAMPGDRERCLEAGATEYISKPASLKSLLQCIQTLLGKVQLALVLMNLYSNFK